MKNLRELIDGPVQSIVEPNYNSGPSKVSRRTEEDMVFPDEIEREGIAQNSRKIQKFKREDFKKAKLKHIGLPRKLKPNAKCKRRYGVDVIYLAPVLNKEGQLVMKEKKKLVRFGKEGKSDYVDHKDNLKRLNSINKFKNADNFLHPNFYNQYLLNSNFDNTYDAHRALVNALDLE